MPDLSKAYTLDFPSFTLVTASAGSGKTYQLAWRVAQYLLSGIPFEQVLAITFTRNAAREMKERILRALKDVAIGDVEALAEVALRLGPGAAGAQARAAALLDAILERYGDLDISTIDSFMTRLFRASALEYGFDPAFEIVLQHDNLLDDAFERLERKLYTGSDEAAQLKRIADMIDRDRYVWDPLQQIRAEVGALHTALSSHVKPPVVEDGSTAIRASETEVREMFERLHEAAVATGLVLDRNFVTLAARVREGGIAPLLERARREPSNVVNKGGLDKAAYEARVGALAPLCDALNAALENAAVAGILHGRYPVVYAAHRLQEELDEVKRRSGRLLLEDIGRMLIRRLEEGAIPEIYLRLGERLLHFLIDEFQDTSPIQWGVLEPLLAEAMSVQGSLFIVGDTKQSIYGFRGADWRIMRGLTARTFPSASFHEVTLPVNYRSGGEILRYNEETFTSTVPAHGEEKECRASGLDRSAQVAKPGREGDGYVETRFIPRAQENADREAVIDIVRDCLERGYTCRDIDILTPANDSVITASGWLKDAGYPVLSHSSLDARNRTVVREMFALLRFLDAPVDDLAFATVLLGRVFAARAEEYDIDNTIIERCILEARRTQRPVYKIFQSELPVLWADLFEPLFTVVGYAPLYDLLCDACRILAVFRLHPDEEAAVSSMLEAAVQLEQRGGNSVRDFLAAADDERESSLWAMQPPAAADAVTLMTIHKAKGLDFPVVIVLLYGKSHSTLGPFLQETEQGVRVLALTKSRLNFAPQFAALYNETVFRGTVDALNRLYVALTRAEQEMYVLGVYGTARSPDQIDPPVAWLPQRESDPSHPKPPVRRAWKDPHPPASTEHHHMPVPRVFDGVTLRNYGAEHRGTVLHAVLEQIEFLPHDVPRAIDDALAKIGFIETPDLTGDSLRTALTAFFADAAVRALFAPDPRIRIFREQECVLATGALQRIDRMHVTDDSVLVIDYKTGGDEHEEQYVQQVRGYMAAVAEIYPGRRIEGTIVYIDRCRVVRVPV